MLQDDDDETMNDESSFKLTRQSSIRSTKSLPLSLEVNLMHNFWVYIHLSFGWKSYIHCSYENFDADTTKSIT